MRTAAETYLQHESTLVKFSEAVTHVAASMNSVALTRGFTPPQWILNSNPRDPSAITSDDFNPSVHHGALEDPEFAAELERRSIARLGFVKAGSNARLRELY